MSLGRSVPTNEKERPFIVSKYTDASKFLTMRPKLRLRANEGFGGLSSRWESRSWTMPNQHPADLPLALEHTGKCHLIDRLGPTRAGLWSDHSAEFATPKLQPILDWSVKFSIQFGVQSGVQSQTPAYFGIGLGIALQNVGVLKCPATRGRSNPTRGSPTGSTGFMLLRATRRAKGWVFALLNLPTSHHTW